MAHWLMLLSEIERKIEKLEYANVVQEIWKKIPKCKLSSEQYDMNTLQVIRQEKSTIETDDAYLFLGFANCEIQVTAQQTLFVFPQEEIALKNHDQAALQFCLRKLRLFLRIQK